MWSNGAALEHGSGPRLPDAAMAGLGGLLAAALFLGASEGGRPNPAVLDGGVPKPARAAMAAPASAAGGGGPARPSTAGLCFRGPGGEILDLASAGQPCP